MKTTMEKMKEDKALEEIEWEKIEQVYPYIRFIRAPAEQIPLGIHDTLKGIESINSLEFIKKKSRNKIFKILGKDILSKYKRALKLEKAEKKKKK